MGPSVKSVSYMLDSIAKDKSGVKKYLEIISIKGGEGGVRRLMRKSILNFHFDYLNLSLSLKKSVLRVLFLIISWKTTSLRSCTLQVCNMRILLLLILVEAQSRHKQ